MPKGGLKEGGRLERSANRKQEARTAARHRRKTTENAAAAVEVATPQGM